MTKLPERNLDVLRACAVLSVWVSHLMQAVTHGSSSALTALGRIGVLAFFVHTALVLMSSIERGGGDESPSWVRTFYARRAARIYPLVWVTIALCIVAALPYSLEEVSGPRPALELIHSLPVVTANALLVQNVVDLPNVIGPLWTLPLEAQMYLLLPGAFMLARRRGAATVMLAIVAAALGAMALSMSRPSWLPRVNVIGFAPCFLAGVWAYAQLRKRQGSAPAALWLVLVPLWWVAALYVPIMALPVGWLACLVLAVAIASTQELEASVVTRAAAHVAQYSYGIYLLHMPAWMLAARLEAPAAVRWTVYALLLVAMPVAAYHLIEAPAIRWMRERSGVRPTRLSDPSAIGDAVSR
jgi:peptidoglycan/LPS O-acetylase OafA/YrhL